MTKAQESSASEGTGYVDVGAFRLRYRIEGVGIPTLVVGSSIYYPRTFSLNLRKHLRLVFVDHRGFAAPSVDATNGEGKSAPECSEFELDVLLNDIEVVRKKLGLDQFCIVGHSGHSYMALEYAKKFPQHVTHVVLIAAGPNQSAESHAAAEQYWQDSVCPERKKVLDQNLQKLNSELTANPEKRFITFCIRLGARSWYDYEFDSTPLWEGVEVNMKMFDHVWGTVFRDIDITRGLESFDTPVFLGLGRYDFLVAPPASWNSIRKKFKKLTVRVFEKSSHTPQYEEPALFEEELLRWWGETSPSQTR